MCVELNAFKKIVHVYMKKYEPVDLFFFQHV